MHGVDLCANRDESVSANHATVADGPVGTLAVVIAACCIRWSYASLHWSQLLLALGAHRHSRTLTDACPSPLLISPPPPPPPHTHTSLFIFVPRRISVSEEAFPALSITPLPSFIVGSRYSILTIPARVSFFFSRPPPISSSHTSELAYQRTDLYTTMHSQASFNDSEYVASPHYGRSQRLSAGTSAVSSPMRRTGNKIDFTKFKTKMCRNFVNNIPCPFGDMCAFSHGADVELMSGDDSNSAPSSPAVPLPKSRRGLASFAVQGLAKEEALKGSYENLTSLTENSSGDSVASESMGLPPPPAYDEAVQDETVVVMPDAHSLVEARPPAYPTRFRYDPYSYGGVLYV